MNRENHACEGACEAHRILILKNPGDFRYPASGYPVRRGLRFRRQDIPHQEMTDIQRAGPDRRDQSDAPEDTERFPAMHGREEGIDCGSRACTP